MTDTLKQEIARALVEPLGYYGKTLEDAEHIWIGDITDSAGSGSLAYLCNELATAALSVVQPRIERLETALRALLDGSERIARYHGIDIDTECAAYQDSPFAKARAALTHKQTKA